MSGCLKLRLVRDQVVPPSPGRAALPCPRHAMLQVVKNAARRAPGRVQLSADGQHSATVLIDSARTACAEVLSWSADSHWTGVLNQRFVTRRTCPAVSAYGHRSATSVHHFLSVHRRRSKVGQLGRGPSPRPNPSWPDRSRAGAGTARFPATRAAEAPPAPCTGRPVQPAGTRRRTAGLTTARRAAKADPAPPVTMQGSCGKPMSVSRDVHSLSTGDGLPSRRRPDRTGVPFSALDTPRPAVAVHWSSRLPGRCILQGSITLTQNTAAAGT